MKNCLIPIAIRGSRHAHACLTGLLVLAGLPVANAANVTWTGNAGTLWTTAANWTPGAPNPDDALIFGTSSQLTPENNFPAGTTFSGLTFNPSASGSYALTGLAIGLIGPVANSSPILQTISLPIVITNAITFNTVSNVLTGESGDLLVDGVTSGAGSLVKLGGGVLTINNKGYAGGTTVSNGWLVAKNDNGNYTLSGGSLKLNYDSYWSAPTVAFTTDASVGTDNGRVDFAGAMGSPGFKWTKIGAGTMNMVHWSTDPLSVVKASAIVVAEGTLGSVINGGNLVQWGGSNVNITVANGAALAANDGVTVQNAVILEGGEGTGRGVLLSGRVNAGSATNLNTFTNRIRLDTTSTVGTYGGTLVLAGNITGPGGFTKIGQADAYSLNKLVLAGTNTYAGDTTIMSGTVQLGSSSALPGGPTNGNVWIYNDGTLDFNGFSASVNGFSDDTLGNGTVNNSHPTSQATWTFGGNDQFVSFFGPVVNTGAALNLVKRGTGSASLNGPNAIKGGISVQGGSLTFGMAGSSATNGPVILADGTQLSLVKATAGAALRPSAVTLGTSGATTLDIDFGSFGSPSVAVLTATNGTGTLSVGGNVTVNIAGNGNVMSSGQFPLIRYLVRSGTGTFTLGTLPTDVVATIVTNTVNKSIDLKITSSPVTKWVGNLGWDWDIGVTKNWSKLGVSGYYADGLGVIFDDTAFTNNVNLTTTLSPLATLVDSGSNYVFEGVGSINNGDLVKSGSGTLTLLTDNNAYNNTIISAGTLQVGNGGSTGSLGYGTVQNEATLAFNHATDLVVASVIKGGGAVVKQSTNTLQMDGANLYSGGSTVSQGVLKLGNATALGTPGTALPLVTIASGAGLDINGKLVATANSIRIGGLSMSTNQGSVFNSGAGTYIGGTSIGVNTIALTADAAIGNDGGMWDVNGGLSGNGFNLTKVGNNTINFRGTAVNSPGQVIVGNGSIYYMRANCLGTTATIVLSNNVWMNTWDQNGWTGFTIPNNFIIGAGGGQIRNSQGAWYGHANYDAYSGNITLNDTLTLLNTSTYSGAPNPAGVVTHGTMVLNGNISGVGGLFCSAAAADGGNVITLNGVNTYTGPTTITNGTLFVTTGQQGGGAYTNMDGATLVVAMKPGYASLPMSSLAIGSSTGAVLSLQRLATLTTNAPITATNLTVIGVNQVGLPTSAMLLTSGQFPLIKYSGTVHGAGSFTLGGRGIGGYISNNVANGSIDYVATPANPVTWTGSSGNVWDIGTTANWKYLGAPTTYQPGDMVLFNDSSLQTTVNVSVAVAPSLILVSNTTTAYMFTNQPITGAASLIKAGAGTLTLSTNNSFTGGALVSGGVVTLGSDGALNNTLGTVTVTDAGAVDFNNWNPTVLACTISGAGYLGKGTLVANYTNAATTKGPKTITLAGDATIGGSNRWDLRATGAALISPTNAYTLTKVGANQISLVAAAVSTNLGDIKILGGTLSFETTSTYGDTNKTIYVGTGGALGLYQNTMPLTKSVICSNGAGISALGGNTAAQNIIAAPVTLVSGTVNFNANYYNSMSFSNVISGSGGITLQVQSIIKFAATNTYTGNTYIPRCNGQTDGYGTRLLLLGNGSIANSARIIMAGIQTGQAYAGFIDVLGRTDKTFTLANNQILQGDNGSFVRGNVVASLGSTITPGGNNGIQYMGCSNNLTFMAGSTNFMDVSAASPATNDMIYVGTNITYGGTLQINRSTTNWLVAGQSFKLFSAATYAGTFSSVVSTTSDQFVTWDTSQLPVNGTITVVSATASSRPNLTSSLNRGNLSFTWPADHLGWTLQTNSVDVASPAYWFAYPGSSTVTNVSFPIAPSKPQVFFRLSYP